MFAQMFNADTNRPIFRLFQNGNNIAYSEKEKLARMIFSHNVLAKTRVSSFLLNILCTV